MEIWQDSLDAVLYNLYDKIEKHGAAHTGSRGKNRELIGVSLKILKPRARLSISENRGKVFSALGELLWYLSGSDDLDFIESYVRQYRNEAVDGRLEGAYGPRLLNLRGGINQFDSIYDLLGEKPGSRRAVIQLFNAEDIATPHKEIPCTTTMQFHLRNNRLHMSVTMRSNDAYLGLPHDVFCFTMIQEMMACRLGVELGEYYQYVGSMHVYDTDMGKTRDYRAEGFQPTVEMPPMPAGNPFELVNKLLSNERKLRAGDEVCAESEFGEVYWADILRLLQVFWVFKTEGDSGPLLNKLEGQLSFKGYIPFIRGRNYAAKRAK